jgi:hypothetical protein
MMMDIAKPQAVSDHGLGLFLSRGDAATLFEGGCEFELTL